MALSQASKQSVFLVSQDAREVMLGQHFVEHLYNQPFQSVSGLPFFMRGGMAKVQAALLAEVATYLHMPETTEAKVRFRMFNLASAILAPPWDARDKQPEKGWKKRLRLFWLGAWDQLSASQPTS